MIVQFPKDRSIDSLDPKQRETVRKRQFALRDGDAIDVETLAADLNAKIRFRAPKIDPERRGAVYFASREQSYVVLVNPEQSESSVRFTIAHELSHILLHSDKIGIDTLELYRRHKRSLIETEANELAIELLVPGRLLINKIRLGANDPKQLAETFGVSREAIELRLLNL